MDKENPWDFLIPKTALGKSSIVLAALFFLLLPVFLLLVASGQRGGETFSDNMYLSVTGLIMDIAAISAFFTGIISIIISKERALLVLLSTLIGLFVLLFNAGEFLFPH